MSLPTLIDVRDSLSDNVRERWSIIHKAISEHYVNSKAADLGKDASGIRDRSAALSASRPVPECPDRPEADSDISRYTLARNAVSVGRAIRFPSDQEAGRAMDDYDDLDRPVDIPGLRGGQREPSSQ